MNDVPKPFTSHGTASVVIRAPPPSPHLLCPGLPCATKRASVYVGQFTIRGGRIFVASFVSSLLAVACFECYLEVVNVHDAALDVALFRCCEFGCFVWPRAIGMRLITGCNILETAQSDENYADG